MKRNKTFLVWVYVLTYVWDLNFLENQFLFRLNIFGLPTFSFNGIFLRFSFNFVRFQRKSHFGAQDIDNFPHFCSCLLLKVVKDSSYGAIYFANNSLDLPFIYKAFWRIFNDGTLTNIHN